MFLLSANHKNKSSRFKSRLFKPLRLNRKLAFFTVKSGKKHNLYHKTTHFKFAHAALLSFDKKFPKWYFFCSDFFALKTRFLGVFKNANGSFFSAPLVDALKLGDKVTWLRNSYTKFFYLSIGVVSKLRFLKLATLVCNVGYSLPVFATAFGTFAKIRLIRKKEVTIILPSGKWQSVSPKSAGIIGRNSAPKHLKEVLGKASERRFATKRIVVRSSAKNPVDHPNGGRTRGKILFKTPWGKVAKKNK